MRGLSLLLVCLGAASVGCGGDEGAVQPPPTAEDGGSTPEAVAEADAPAEDPTGSLADTCTGEPAPVDLPAANPRSFARAARAVSELERGLWPGVAPTVSELVSHLGPSVGPVGGRFVGRLSSTRLDALYLSPPTSAAPVHVIAVLDFGPSIRNEVPLVIAALETVAGRLASTARPEDRLSVVEWTDQAGIGVRLAPPSDAPSSVAGYALGLRDRVQFGGSPSLSVVEQQVLTLASEAPVRSHVVVFTDGSMSAADPGTLGAVEAWRAADLAVSLVEVQAYDGEEPAEVLASHDAILDDRAISDAAYYLAAPVVGDPTRPPARSIPPEHRGPFDHLFSRRFDDLFRPTEMRARFEVSAPVELGLVPIVDDGATGEGKGYARLGEGGSVSARAAVNPACGGFTGRVRVLGVRATEPETEIEIASADVTFDAATSLPAYGALLDALEGIARSAEANSCVMAGFGPKAAGEALKAASLEGMEEAERAAFEASRTQTINVLLGMKSLCPE
jgi:hypothetical protein